MLGVLAAYSPARGVEIKLWPLIEYHSEPSGDRVLHLLGPLFAYERRADQFTLTLRPLFTYAEGPRVSHNELAVLYPFFVSRWEPERTEYRLLGLISYTRETVHRPDEWDRRFTVFPFIFYRYSRTLGTWLSVLPFYANVRDFLGYERIQTILFPLYLRLQEPLADRRWVLFPVVSWSDGPLARGYRIWPFYGWEEEGDVERFRYVMWPFYISRERHFTRPEAEQQLILFPFYASTDSATKRSRSYIGPFFTHTIDHKEDTETWGFPWPLWLSKRDLKTGKRIGLRITPFYEDTQLGNRRSQFVMWPAYRWATQETDSYRHTRSDVFLVVYRNIEEVQPEYHHQRHLYTLLPLYRATDEDGAGEFSTLALLDALFPHNPTIKELYAPLWQLFRREHDDQQPPRWSLLWDLISSDGTQVRYPVHLDLSQ
jgi:hypothetical protein